MIIRPAPMALAPGRLLQAARCPHPPSGTGAVLRQLTPQETAAVSGGNALDTVTGSFVSGGGGCTSHMARMMTCFI